MRKVVSILGAALTSILIGVDTTKQELDNSLISGINVIEVEMEGQTYNFLYDAHKLESVVDVESSVSKELTVYPHTQATDTFTLIESEFFEVKDFSNTKDNVESLTGEKIDGVMNEETLNKIDQTKIKIKNYKPKE